MGQYIVCDVITSTEFCLNACIVFTVRKKDRKILSNNDCIS